MSRVVVEAIHYDQIVEHGGLKRLRDEAALEAALARPQNKWHYKPDVDVETLSAAYAYGIAQNHPFHDGNKRVAFVTMVVFLELDGRRFTADEADVVKTIMGLAAGDVLERRLATWIRKNTAS